MASIADRCACKGGHTDLWQGSVRALVVWRGWWPTRRPRATLPGRRGCRSWPCRRPRRSRSLGGTRPRSAGRSAPDPGRLDQRAIWPVRVPDVPARSRGRSRAARHDGRLARRTGRVARGEPTEVALAVTRQHPAVDVRQRDPEPAGVCVQRLLGSAADEDRPPAAGPDRLQQRRRTRPERIRAREVGRQRRHIAKAARPSMSPVYSASARRAK